MTLSRVCYRDATLLFSTCFCGMCEKKDHQPRPGPPPGTTRDSPNPPKPAIRASSPAKQLPRSLRLPVASLILQCAALPQTARQTALLGVGARWLTGSTDRGILGWKLDQYPAGASQSHCRQHRQAGPLFASQPSLHHVWPFRLPLSV